MSHDSDPVEEPPLNIPEPPSTPTNPDQLVGPDGPDGPDAEHAEPAGKRDGSSREHPKPTIPVASASASTGPDGPAPSIDGSTAGEAAVAAAVEPNSDTEVNLDDVDPVDDPSNPDLVGRDVDDDDPTRAEPTTRTTTIPPAPKPGPKPRNLKESL
ncbi:hypothetical protein [Cryobacterium sp. Hb1]|uniref:hypothetical protein n=1 Tax=Cryobacterium sp. Hb1 TaxID=1259147 RepID=UPI00106B4B58|nr:hypothetical protein [Cryobacterium sp. Hb1]TFD72493.1 hypothetical protein E3T38_01070 [Cryobacterium sp. Hb1]